MTDKRSFPGKKKHLL